MGLTMSSTSELLHLSQNPTDTQMDRYLLHMRKGLKADLEAERKEFQQQVGDILLRAMSANAESVASLAASNAALSTAFHTVNERLEEVCSQLDSTSSKFLKHINAMSAEMNDLAEEIEMLRARPMLPTMWAEFKAKFKRKDK